MVNINRDLYLELPIATFWSKKSEGHATNFCGPTGRDEEMTPDIGGQRAFYQEWRVVWSKNVSFLEGTWSSLYTTCGTWQLVYIYFFSLSALRNLM